MEHAMRLGTPALADNLTDTLSMHLLLVVAVAVILVRIIQGRRAALESKMID